MNLLLGAVVLAAMYALVGFAWVLLNRTTGILNLATGAQLAVGAFLFYQFSTVWRLPWIWVVLATLASILLMAFLTHAVIFRKLAGHPEFSLVIATLGLASILKGISAIAFGVEPRVIREPIPNEVVEVSAGALTTRYGLIGIAAAIAVLGLTAIFFRYTRVGVQMRAAAENAVLAAQSGIPVDRVYVLGWAIALSAAAMAGLLYSYQNVLSFAGADSLGLRGLAPALVGGVTSIAGVIPGALITGIAETFGVRLFGGSAQDVAAWIVILVVLMIRPQGLFGSKRVDRV